MVYDDNSDEEDNLSYRSDEDELLNDNRSSELEEEEEEEEALGNDSDYLEELPPEEDDASYCTESSFRSHSTLGSTPGEEPCKGTHAHTLAECCCFAAALFKMELQLRIRPLFTAAPLGSFCSSTLLLGLPSSSPTTTLSRLVLHFVPTTDSIIFCLCRFNSY